MMDIQDLNLLKNERDHYEAMSERLEKLLNSSIKTIERTKSQLTEAENTISELREIPFKLREQTKSVFRDEEIGTFITDLLNYADRLVSYELLTPPTETSKDDHQSTSTLVDNQISGDMSDKDDSERVCYCKNYQHCFICEPQDKGVE